MHHDQAVFDDNIANLEESATASTQDPEEFKSQNLRL